MNQPMFTLNCKGSLWLIQEPVVMGIINSTPDSFYAASRTNNVDNAIALAEKMVEEGASILDIGGQSTRPGSELIDVEEELRRVMPLIEAINKKFPLIRISIDTFHPKVAQNAVAAGASMVNDISGGRFYADMLSTVASLNVPYICMHSRGNTKTMHQKPNSDNIVLEIAHYFIERLDACKKAGIKDVIIDPGFGFGKTVNNNFALLKDLKNLQMFKSPILLGVSRKSSIYQTLGITPEASLNGTTVLNTIGLMNNVQVLRVHDVKEAMEAIQLTNLLK
jgi:dihydropteroate synthase